MPLWNAPPNPTAVTFQYLLIGGAFTLTPVIWTLFLEMRISLFFPALARIVRHGSWTIVLPCAVAIFAFAASMKPGAFGLLAGLCDTLEFSTLFVFGAMAAKHRVALRMKFSALSCRRKSAAALAIVLLYWVGLPSPDSANRRAMMCVVAVLILSLVIAWPKLDRILSRAPLIWLGKISYSLYLVHFVILGSLLYALNGMAPIWVSVLPVLPCSLLSAALLQRYVEAPFIRLSHRHAPSPSVP
jgi:peptidoglycan/LPS O-acetylase OafA/YrhL